MGANAPTKVGLSGRVIQTSTASRNNSAEKPLTLSNLFINSHNFDGGSKPLEERRLLLIGESNPAEQVLHAGVAAQGIDHRLHAEQGEAVGALFEGALEPRESLHQPQCGRVPCPANRSSQSSKVSIF